MFIILDTNQSDYFRGRNLFTMDHLPALFDEYFQKVKSLISEAPFISLTTDAWTDAANKHSILSVTGFVIFRFN